MESLQTDFPLTSDKMSHRYAVGLSADISAASVSLTGFCSVFTVYHMYGGIDEESVNVLKRNYFQ